MAEKDLHLMRLQRLDMWLALSKLHPGRLPLLEHMGMTVDEFIEWRLSRLQPEEDK